MYENYPIHNLDALKVKLISADEANLWALRVIENPQLWERRVGFFYTLGSTAYLDTQGEYQSSLRESNFKILSIFSDLHEKILKHFNAKLSSQLAVPGFHIFNHLSNGKTGDIHIDIPFDQQVIPFTYSNPFSFTLCLKLPSFGGGLNYWDDLSTIEQQSMLEGASLPHKKQYLAYEPGTMYIHDGFCPHQIAQLGDMKNTEYRITLQGHGMTHSNGTKIVYF